ncbi:MAG: hypothetical protein ACK5LV_04385 [Lachnospirales bacterium]
MITKLENFEIINKNFTEKSKFIEDNLWSIVKGDILSKSSVSSPSENSTCQKDTIKNSSISERIRALDMICRLNKIYNDSENYGNTVFFGEMELEN